MLISIETFDLPLQKRSRIIRQQSSERFGEKKTFRYPAPAIFLSNIVFMDLTEFFRWKILNHNHKGFGEEMCPETWILEILRISTQEWRYRVPEKVFSGLH